MNKNRKRVAPLPSFALAILRQQAKVRSGDAAFLGPRRSPLNADSFARVPGKAGVDAGLRIHGDRSSATPAATGCRADRGHTLGAVEGAYRRETAIEARLPVMEAYAAWLLDDGANVIPFPARA